MPVESLIPLIADSVFGYLLDQSGLGEAVRDRLRPDPVKQAFQHALGSTLTQFEKQHPEWVASLFDADFLRNEAVPILVQFLIRDGEPDPSDLATRWADSLNLRQSEQRTARIRELEPIAAELLDSLNRALKAEPVLRGINDSRTLEEIAGGVGATLSSLDRISADLEAFRRRLDSDKATPGTLRDYLHWMIERNLYLDPRGTLQTQRQVQVRLDEIYISLRAQREEMPGTVDRRLVEKEIAELEAKLAAAGLPPEDLEDQREQLLVRFGELLLPVQVQEGAQGQVEREAVCWREKPLQHVILDGLLLCSCGCMGSAPVSLPVLRRRTDAFPCPQWLLGSSGNYRFRHSLYDS